MKRKFQKFGGINVILLGIVSLINDFSSEMIIPILPLFITSLGGTSLIIGLIGGLRESIESILKVFSGFWSDKIGKRKPFIFTGYLSSSIFKLFLAFSTIWQHVLIFTGLERVGKGVRDAPRDALISESMPKQKGKGFGLHRSLDTTGAVLGSIAVLLILIFFNLTFKNIIIIASIIGFFSLIPLFFVKEPKIKPKKIKLSLSLKQLPKSLKIFIMIGGIFAFANFSYMFFILKAGLLFEGNIRNAIIFPIALYILFNIFYASLAMPFGKLSDKIGRRKMLITGYLLFSLTCIGFAIFNSLPAFILLFALYGTSYAIIIAGQKAFVSDLSPSKLRATALGTFDTTIGLIALPASLIAGALWIIHPNVTFIFGGLMSLLAVLLFVIFSSYFKN